MEIITNDIDINKGSIIKRRRNFADTLRITKGVLLLLLVLLL